MMAYLPLITFLGISIVGTIVLMFSRTLNASEEDRGNEERWFREMLYGPPGYSRAVVVILGVILIIVGVIGVFRVLFFP